MNRVLALILAGGEHPALSILTAERAEAAVPFAGKYRIIDFTLSNCVNSGITNVGVLTQYRPRSLQEHIGVGKPWDLDRRIGGVHILHPYMGASIGWQKGNADALRANIDFIAEQPEEIVLVLAGDHIYKMDYRPMIQAHLANNANVTVAVHAVGSHEVHRFGIVTVDSNSAVSRFEEKPKRSTSTLASMGIYLFRKEYLLNVLRTTTEENIGRDLMPTFVRDTSVHAYHFQGYWADVGTLQAYYEASMALLTETPALDISDPNWIIHTKSAEMPAAEVGTSATINNSLICDGSRVNGHVSGSIIGPGVSIPADTHIIDSIIFPDVVIEPGCRIERCIIDRATHIHGNSTIGHKHTATPNQATPTLLNTGLTLIGAHTTVPVNTTIGSNVIIQPRADISAWSGRTIADGASL
ncbi:MAG: glucose-1-phosphate adenylyltransferase family protein [Roseiflexaceae bacterium]